MPVPGGMMAIGIPDYRLPRAELNRDIDAMRRLLAEVQKLLAQIEDRRRRERGEDGFDG